MTKLQKHPPPTYPGKPSSSAPLQTAVPYENLPQASHQPVPTATAVTPSAYNDLPSTNPFSPNFTPLPVPSGPHSSPANAHFSPISPIVESRPIERHSQAQVLHVPQPHRPDAQRRSADLRRLDGKPYPGSHSAEKTSKHVKVARDMHDGALPPVYKRQASDPINPAEVAQALSNAHECGKCGKKRGEGQNGHGNGCNHCGKRKASAPEGARVSNTAATPAHHARRASEGTVSHHSRPSNSPAGPSSSSGPSTERKCCDKCGKYKRPTSGPRPQLPADLGRPGRSGPPTAPVPMAIHPAMKIHQAGLAIQPNHAGPHNPVYPKIDVIPPSASTYKPVNSPFTSYGDDSPLVGKATKQEFKLFRNSSLARSLSRRLSKKDKTSSVGSGTAPLPSQQLPADDQSAGRLINMISSAMQGPQDSRDTPYSKLDAAEQPDRPQTPFSFVGGTDEQEAFEMIDFRDSRGGSVSDQDSLKDVVNDREIGITRSEDDSAIPQDTIDVIPRPKSAGPQSPQSHGQHLSVQDAESRPPITRFKSLRSGVSRMNSNISRSTSLKRLGSLKTVHHNWYRNDMAIEGAMGDDDHTVAVF